METKKTTQELKNEVQSLKNHIAYMEEERISKSYLYELNRRISGILAVVGNMQEEFFEKYDTNSAADRAALVYKFDRMKTMSDVVLYGLYDAAKQLEELGAGD